MPEVEIVPEPVEPKPEPEAKPEPESKPDAYAEVDEEYREYTRDNDELINNMGPMDRLRMSEMARRTEQLVSQGVITHDQLMGTAPATPAPKPAPIPEPAPKKTSKSDEVSERMTRLENIMLEDRAERKQRTQAEERDKIEKQFDSAISDGLDSHDIEDDELRDALTDEFTGKFMRTKNKPGPEGYSRAVSKFLKGKIDASAKREDDKRTDYLLSKLAQRDATNTETRGAGAAPAKETIKLTVEQAKRPEHVARAVKEKRGIA